MNENKFYMFGKDIEDMSRDELIKVIKMLAREYAELTSPEAIRARAVGQVEIIKQNAREAARNLSPY